MEIRLLTVSLIILGTGVLGGTASYLASKPDEVSRSAWLTSCILGITAAGITPLFLSTISSNLLSDIFAKSIDYSDYLTFSGFCLLAAFSSRTFIKNLSNAMLEAKVNKTARGLKGIENKVEKDRPAIEAIVNRNTEEDVEQSVPAGALQPPVTGRQQDILVALDSHEKFKLRTLSGISSELKKAPNSINITKDELLNDLKDMEALGLAVEIKGKKGLRWSSTASGSTIASSNSGNLDPRDFDRDPAP